MDSRAIGCDTVTHRADASSEIRSCAALDAAGRQASRRGEGDETTVMEASGLAARVRQDGFCVVPDILTAAAVDALLDALAATGARLEADARAGTRALLSGSPAVAAIVCAPAVRGLAAAVLGPACFAVRTILFDKTPGANWKVAWHQDLTIAVRARREVAGYGPWSEKEGVPHVQPPAAVLERMVTVRLHLDDCGEENGPVRVIPGSHASGRLRSEAIAAWRDRVSEHSCVVARGGALVMRPLLLHASSPARAASHRRVLHIDYAAGALDGGLDWHDRH